MTAFAHSVVLNNRATGEPIMIDGIPFPFYVGVDVDIEPGGADALTVVRLPVFVMGTVVYNDGVSRRVIDQQLGDVGAWARELVRTGLLERLPWLAAS